MSSINKRKNTNVSASFLERMSAPKNHDFELKDPKEFKYDIKLHPSIHNFDTIKWLRRRLGVDNIENSIKTLLPNNGIVEENETNKLTIFLENYLKENRKSKELILNPNYIFSAETLTKILILKDIFLEFDEDGSRKLELKEMVEMFISNRIYVQKKTLANLFFPEKYKEIFKTKSDEENENNEEKLDDLYLDFFQFMMFGLSPISDQKFRDFMRKIRKTSKVTDEHIFSSLKKQSLYEDRFKTMVFLKINETSDNPHIRNSTIVKQKDMEKNKKIIKEDYFHFLPMNFNLMLDYFNKNNKVRGWSKEIKVSIVYF